MEARTTCCWVYTYNKKVKRVNQVQQEENGAGTQQRRRGRETNADLGVDFLLLEIPEFFSLMFDSLCHSHSRILFLFVFSFHFFFFRRCGIDSSDTVATKSPSLGRHRGESDLVTNHHAHGY
jgi:hypothetical protein